MLSYSTIGSDFKIKIQTCIFCLLKTVWFVFVAMCQQFDIPDNIQTQTILKCIEPKNGYRQGRPL